VEMTSTGKKQKSTASSLPLLPAFSLLKFSLVGGIFGTIWLGALLIPFKGHLDLLKGAFIGYLMVGLPVAFLTGLIYWALLKLWDVQGIGERKWWLACLVSSLWLPLILAIVWFFSSSSRILDTKDIATVGFIILFFITCTGQTASLIRWLELKKFWEAALLALSLIAWSGFYFLSRESPMLL
jgi:hypothetical protein